ncbi:DUF1353 domain-containing protein [Nocardioides panacisoli]|uniref:DUF1353 domain-containing protein n=1 Tax=Nocardioides panacisoli TaxID=627624 RepID=UPI001C634EF6|nr:DUF1353 domain-containing protein [Nocardioides panacisoli]QYJ04186.1 DUF1353 domain-containing protein [Nocardioides panacisoli]
MDLRPQPEQPDRFHDAEDGPGSEPRIVLQRELDAGVERFRMLRRLAYRDEEYGEIVVPDDLDTFRTDLASVPTLFTWLVPRSGRHLPAALVHDGLVHDAPGSPPHYVSVEGHVIDRVGADRVFRSAMRDSGTRVVRRWLVWSAVTLATIWGGSATWTPARHWRYRLAMVGSLLVVAVLGVLATLDLFDRGVALPWMGEAAWWVELAGGAAGAVVVPLLLCLAWGRFAVAGAVTGVALALLLHVTVVLALLLVAYRAAEWLAVRRPLALVVTAGVVVAAAAVLVVALFWT